MEFSKVKGVSNLLVTRSYFKRKINLDLNDLKTLEDLTEIRFQRDEKSIGANLAEIANLNQKIYEGCYKAELNLETSGFLEDEAQERAYYNDVNNQLDCMRISISSSNTAVIKDAAGSVNVHNQTFASLPRLTCAKFSGNKPDKFEFKNFLSQFYNCVNSVSSEKTKLSLLKSYLTGYAGQLISHLTLEDSNYGVAIDLLTEEFLDIPYIVDEIFKQLLDASPKYDPNFTNVKQFLSEMRADLSELRSSYDLNFFEENTPGFKLVSHIIFAKLPGVLQRELVHKVGTNYPTLIDIYDNYNEAIKTLIKTGMKKTYSHFHSNRDGSKPRSWHITKKRLPQGRKKYFRVRKLCHNDKQTSHIL